MVDPFVLHRLPNARLLGTAEVDVKHSRHPPQHHHPAAAEHHAPFLARAGHGLLEVAADPPLLQVQLAAGIAGVGADRPRPAESAEDLLADRLRLLVDLLDGGLGQAQRRAASAGISRSSRGTPSRSATRWAITSTPAP